MFSCVILCSTFCKILYTAPCSCRLARAMLPAMVEDKSPLTPHEHGDGSVPVPVPVAATYLGISERAVRKRIGAGTLRGVLVNRSWLVYLSSAETLGEARSGPERTGTAGPDRNARVVPEGGTEASIAAAIIREAIAPFVLELAATHEALGRERLLREQAEGERDDLMMRLNARTRDESTAREELSSAASQGVQEHSETLANRVSPSSIGARLRRWLLGD